MYDFQIRLQIVIVLQLLDIVMYVIRAILLGVVTNGTLCFLLIYNRIVLKPVGPMLFLTVFDDVVGLYN